MNASAVSSAYSHASTQAMEREKETKETKKAGADGDEQGDKRGAATPVSPSPTSDVNLDGQTVGQIIHVTA
jgi:hypothetical protein